MYRLSKWKDFPMYPAASGEFYLHYIFIDEGMRSAVLTRDVSEAKLFIEKSDAEKFITDNELSGFKIVEA